METQLLPEDIETLERLVTSGRFASVSAALHACVQELWSAEHWKEHVRALVQEGIEATDRGEIIPGDQFLNELNERRLRRA